jgi:hypothetical protein
VVWLIFLSRIADARERKIYMKYGIYRLLTGFLAVLGVSIVILPCSARAEIVIERKVSAGWLDGSAHRKLYLNDDGVCQLRVEGGSGRPFEGYNGEQAVDPSSCEAFRVAQKLSAKLSSCPAGSVQIQSYSSGFGEGGSSSRVALTSDCLCQIIDEVSRGFTHGGSRIVTAYEDYAPCLIRLNLDDRTKQAIQEVVSGP